MEETFQRGRRSVLHYRIAICDDEPAALAALSRMLSRDLERAGLSADVSA